MEVFNASQTAMPDSIYATLASSQTGFMSKILENASVSTILLTVFAVAIAYDQGMLLNEPRPLHC